MSVAQKAMTVEDSKGAFAAAVAAQPTGGGLQDGKLSATAYTDQIQTDGEMDANALQQDRHGVPHFYDAPADRGGGIADSGERKWNGADKYMPTKVGGGTI